MLSNTMYYKFSTKISINEIPIMLMNFNYLFGYDMYIYESMTDIQYVFLDVSLFVNVPET